MKIKHLLKVILGSKHDLSNVPNQVLEYEVKINNQPAKFVQLNMANAVLVLSTEVPR